MLESTYRLNTGLFSESRKFTITPDYISFDREDGLVVTWRNSDIVSVKFGRYPISSRSPRNERRRYKMGFRNSAGSEMEIQFFDSDDYQGSYATVYEDIVVQLREIFVEKVVNEKMEDLVAGRLVAINNLQMDRTKISVVRTGLWFGWRELEIRPYHDHIMLVKKQAPEFKLLVDVDRWDGEVVKEVVRRGKERFG